MITIADIDAEELFQNFSKMVVVSEEEQDYDAPTPYRKLEFGDDIIISNKLNFDQTTASMKKKKSENSKNLQTMELKPFKIMDEYFEEEGQIENTMPPSYRIKNKIGILSTPGKSIQQKDELQMAAKKEDPFRDLSSSANQSL